MIGWNNALLLVETTKMSDLEKTNELYHKSIDNIQLYTDSRDVVREISRERNSSSTSNLICHEETPLDPDLANLHN